jgi:hypothetical protein
LYTNIQIIGDNFAARHSRKTKQTRSHDDNFRSLGEGCRGSRRARWGLPELPQKLKQKAAKDAAANPPRPVPPLKSVSPLSLPEIFFLILFSGCAAQPCLVANSGGASGDATD